MDEITLEEALALVSFEKVDGEWAVQGVYGDIHDCVHGDVVGTVHGNIHGDVDGAICGKVHTKVEDMAVRLCIHRILMGRWEKITPWIR